MNLKISHNKDGYFIKVPTNGSHVQGTIESGEHERKVREGIKHHSLSMASSHPDPEGSPDARRGIID